MDVICFSNSLTFGASLNELAQTSGTPEDISAEIMTGFFLLDTGHYWAHLDLLSANLQDHEYFLSSNGNANGK